MNTIYIYFGWLGDKGLQVLNFGEIAINTIGNSIKEIKSENDDRNWEQKIFILAFPN